MQRFDDVPTSFGQAKNNTSQHKLQEQDWNAIDCPVVGEERLVIDAMKKLGEEGFFDNIEKRTYKSMLEFYPNIRNMCISNGMLPSLKTQKKDTRSNDKGKKKSGKKKKVTLNDVLDTYDGDINQAEKYLKSIQYVMKKDEIIKMNSLKNINRYFENIKQINFDNYKVNTSLNIEYIEFRILALMRLIENSIKEPEEFRDYEFVTSLERIHRELTDVYTELVSENRDLQSAKDMILKDFRTLIEFLKDAIGFEYKTFLTKYPKFTFPCEYENIIPKISIKPFDSQLELVKHVKENDQYMILYRVMIGGGKTVTASALASYTHYLRLQEKASKSETSTQLLFVCSVSPVRLHLGKLIWNMGIGLAVATKSKTHGRVEVIKNFNCKGKNENVVVILADIMSAIDLLKQAKNTKTKYIVFFDEPTVGADEDDNAITKAVPHVVKYADKLILSSASLPPEDQIPQLIALHKKTRPDSKIINVDSKDIKVGCEIVSSTNDSITPHTEVSSVKQLLSVIDRIKEQPFIGRLYTAPILYQLYESMIDEDIDVPDINEYFNNVKNWSQSRILNFALILLDLLKDTDDDTVKKVCRRQKRIDVRNFTRSFKKRVIEKPKSESSDSDFEWDESDDEPETDQVPDISETVDFFSLDPADIATKSAIRYANGCLIATKDPIGFAKRMSVKLLKKVKNFSTILKKYEADLRDYNSAVERIKKDSIIKRKTDSKNENGVGDKLDIGNVQDKKDQQIQKLTVPELKFPKYAQINTPYHIQKFSDIPAEFIDSSAVRNILNPDDIDYESLNVPEWVLLLLYSGIGIYMQHNEILSKRYVNDVLNLAEKGKLAFLISDHSINYGANYPLTHVIIHDDMMEHSVNTIFQLLGRAGRIGRSYTAYGHLGPVGLDKLINYINGKENNGNRVEAINLEKACDIIHQQEKDFYEKKAEQEKLDAERKEELEKLKYWDKIDAKKITMEQFKQKEQDEKSWKTVKYNKNKKQSYGDNKSFLIEQCKKLIQEGKYLPPNLKQIARENGLIK